MHGTAVAVKIQSFTYFCLLLCIINNEIIHIQGDSAENLVVFIQ